MILLYVLVIFAAWIVSIWLPWKIYHGILKKITQKWHFIITLVFTFIALAWLALSFWYVEGRQYYYDLEVKRLCAVDGGIKVYETIKLPTSESNQDIDIGTHAEWEEKPKTEYYYEFTEKKIKKGVPSINQLTIRIIRGSDEKVLGKDITYMRSGGGLYGPWPESGFSCPPIRQGPNSLQPTLQTSIFVKE